MHTVHIWRPLDSPMHAAYAPLPPYHALRAHAHALRAHAYAVRTPHSRSTSSLPKPPPTRPRQSLQGLPMTIHSSRMGCRYVLYSRSVRFAWAPSSARKVKMRKHGAYTFARSCVRFRTQLRAFLHAARVVGTVLAVRNHAAYAPVSKLRVCARSVLTFFSRLLAHLHCCSTREQGKKK